jgi:hypothetical protein
MVAKASSIWVGMLAWRIRSRCPMAAAVSTPVPPSLPCSLDSENGRGLFVLRHLVDLQYQRNDAALGRARFRVRGDVLEVQPPHGDYVVRVDFFGDEVERVVEIDELTGEVLAERPEVNLYPATHYVTPREKMLVAIDKIESELEERVGWLSDQGRELEAARLRQRTQFDVEMMREVGFCSGIENYSRHLAGRERKSRRIAMNNAWCNRTIKVHRAGREELPIFKETGFHLFHRQWLHFPIEAPQFQSVELVWLARNRIP